MANPYTITVTSVTKDSPGAGQITIVGTYNQSTAYTQPSQRITIGDFPTNNPNWSRNLRLTDAALFCLRNGAAAGVALLNTGWRAIALVLDPTLTYAPYFTTSPSSASTPASVGVYTGTSNPANNSYVTIGTRTYTFVTSLPGSPSSGNATVLIGGTLDITLQNLINAINNLEQLAVSSTGLTYAYGAAATGDPLVIADSTITSHAVTVRSVARLVATTNYALAATVSPNTNGTWGGANMAVPTVAFTIAVDTEVGSNTYQWQYSRNGGVTWTNMPGSLTGLSFSGATTTTLTCTLTTTDCTGIQFRCIATNSVLGSATSISAQLTIT